MLLKGQKKILFEYGIKLNGKTEYPMHADGIDACLVTHAHLDHSGNLPALYKTEMPITYGTEPTKELSELLIEDSVKVHKKTHQVQRFSKHQIKMFLSRFATYNIGSQIDIGECKVTLHDAGHVCGSTTFELENRKGRKLVYTGDLKVEPQMIEGGAEIVKSDILITESTYANREHPNREELIEKFVAEIKAVIESNGVALVPVFAVGRAQEIISILYKNRLIDYSYLDGMARKATEIMLRHPEFLKNGDVLAKAVRQMTTVGSEIHRGDATNGPSIIVTTAGMLNGGPVLDYITRLNDNSKIFLTGYQVEGTNGRKLTEGQALSIDGKRHEITTPWVYYDFSAHSGKSDLFKYVKQSNPEVVMCVHGEAAVAEEFAENLKIEGFKAYAPRNGDTLKVDF